MARVFDLSEKVTEMGKIKFSMILASALVVSPLAAANAADLVPEPIAVPAPVPVPVYGGDWYLKGFFGISNQQAEGFNNDIISGNPGAFTIVTHEFDSAPFVGLGVGIRHNDWLRFDATGEYRARSNFKGLDYFTGCGLGTGTCTNEYMGHKSEWLFLANAYWDIGEIRGITPYVGAGIGVANVNLDNFQDINQIAGAIHWARDGSEWNFAWALHAGLAYEVTQDLTLDVGYRYVNMGDGVTGTFTSFNPAVTSPGPMTVEDIDSHDIMVGLRWNWGHDSCCQQAAYAQPTYTPPFK